MPRHSISNLCVPVIYNSVLWSSSLCPQTNSTFFYHTLQQHFGRGAVGGGLHPLRCGQRRFIIITAATGLLPPETKKTSEETLQSSRCGKSHLGLQRTFCCGIINACFARHSFDVSSWLSLNDGAVFYFFLLICRWNGPVRIEPFRLFSNMRRLKNDSYPAV